MIKDACSPIEEPPGRGQPESLTSGYITNKITLPTDRDKKVKFLERYGLFIHNAYAKTPSTSIDELPEHKQRIAVLGLADAEQIVEVREADELVGLLAYTAYNREDHPEIFEALSETNNTITRRGLRTKFQNIDDQIGHIIHIAELAVRKDKRGNGVSPRMREVMVEEFTGELVMEIGEIQSASPLKQREKLGPTYFAGEVLSVTEESLPAGFSIEDFRVYGHTKGYMYATQVENANYDEQGVIASSLFEFSAIMPERLPLSTEEERAMKNIINRQSQTGEKCSAVAVTLYRP